MNDSQSYIALPETLAVKQAVTVPSEQIDDDEIASRQLEFVRYLFGYAAYLRKGSRQTPVSDAFLQIFVTLLDILELNAPLEARHCANQLKQILDVTFPDADDGSASGDSD